MKYLGYLLLTLLLTSCGVFKNLDKMSSGVDTMKGSIGSMASDLKKTSSALGGLTSGIKAISLNMLLDPSNTKYVSPSSTTPSASMFAGAQGFVMSAEPDDIVGVVFLFLAEINNSQPDTLSPESERQTDKDKWIKFVAIQLISSLMTQEKVETIIKTESDSVYADSVTTILTLRYLFLTSYMLDVGLMGTPIKTTGGFETAIGYINSVKFIEDLPNKDKLQVILLGFFDQDKLGLNQTVTLPKDLVAKKYFAKLKVKFSKEIDKKYVGTKEYLKIQQEIEDGLK